MKGATTRTTNRGARGFSLLEIMMALAILAFALAVIAASSSSSAILSKRVYRSTAAALLLRGVMLDIEEQYRKDGFPTNDLTDRECELPKAVQRQFKCRYDLLGLNLDEGAIGELTQDSQEVLAQSQEALQESGALDKLNGGGDPGAQRASSLGDAASSAATAGLDLSELSQGGDLMQLIQTILLSGDAGLNLLELCDINISVLQMSMGLMIAELLPRILKRATDRTRKVKIRLSWVDNEGDRTLEIETFTTAVSEEEALQIQSLKDAEALQNAMDPGTLSAPAGGTGGGG